MKYLKYFKYLFKHKWYVLKECFKMGIWWQGITHDLSKFLPTEFIPYANYFYGDYGVNNKCPAKWLSPIVMKVSSSFAYAWLLHQKRNPHHWQYWILHNDDGSTQVLEVPTKYLIEMLADWIGAGLAITGRRDIVDWYEKNKKKIRLHPYSREQIKNWIISEDTKGDIE